MTRLALSAQAHTMTRSFSGCQASKQKEKIKSEKDYHYLILELFRGILALLGKHFVNRPNRREEEAGPDVRFNAIFF